MFLYYACLVELLVYFLVFLELGENMVAGTEGYEKFVSRFIEVSQELDFFEVCKDFIAFLPSKPARILDAGSGAGQNAAALAQEGFTVTAVEPMPEFLSAARKRYKSASITWLKGSLPDMACLNTGTAQFDFVLIDGVWHHIDSTERESAVIRLSVLIKKGGRCAISLRNGPAGLGARVYPTDTKLTIQQFEKHGFVCIFEVQNKSSILPNKENVKWARIVLQKC
ncbi:class I SAM-dependent methyltransferase [Alteromonas stellipolaris]|uniref:class I SAM-dependent methyltransferase n=1 Tax=Alteromonas stellipolaris TaxID=233316 RepID=UPI00273323D4|nr:class I SAM-dependent methyltransferase [Alteromonas stellipolaris]MDP2596003.1 class I SAM-dependent methyltransferase [Alteromonas stellipolaris]